MKIKHIRYHLSLVIQFVSTILLLGVVCVSSPELPVGETAKQWLWIGRMGVLYPLCMGLSLLIYPYKQKRGCPDYYFVVIWTLIILGGIEAVVGLAQIYGFARSNHSLFGLTGTFFNPGPYSGYLAMVFPLCLNRFLKLGTIRHTSFIAGVGYYLSLLVLLLIVCVLPAGMSRSAWLAAGVSGLFVAWQHYQWGDWLIAIWKNNRKKVISFFALGSICLLLGLILLFHLKKDSANGRLFMWKISSHAIAGKPLTGYGYGSFPSAYGNAQEAYFVRDNYTPQEELVAGSPEYAFNEYLHVAVEWGIPILFALLAFIVFCLYKGMKNNRIAACAGIISLAVFAFSSYPMQLPAFPISLLFLLFVCIMGKNRSRLFIFSLLIGLWGGYLWKTNDYEACKKWTQSRLLYNVGAYDAAKKEYETLYPKLRNKAGFMFEYGHCLHKLEDADASNVILQEATTLSCDPMILNIIGKNYQTKGEYEEAEKWLLRSVNMLPGRIYPYYLLAKLYAESGFYQPEKLEKMIEMVLTKEPKVQSTAVKEMREEVGRLMIW